MQFHKGGGVGNNWSVIWRKRCVVCYMFYCSHWLCKGGAEWTCRKQSRNTVRKISWQVQEKGERGVGKTQICQMKPTSVLRFSQAASSSRSPWLSLGFRIPSAVISRFFYDSVMSRACSPSTAECTVPKLERHLVSAGVSHLHRNIISHPLPEVVGKVHLRLREHSVYDCLWDPALQTTQTKTKSDWVSLLFCAF